MTLPTWIATTQLMLARREFRLIARAGTLVLVVLAVARSRSLLGHVGDIGHPDLAWLVGAGSAELVSLVAQKPAHARSLAGTSDDRETVSVLPVSYPRAVDATDN